MTSKLLINEFMFNPSVSGDPDEFIEVKGDTNTDYSAWSLIVVDGDGTAAGKIDNVFTVGVTNSDGYWVTPFQTNALQNGTQTVLLVKDFTGKVGDDLDTANAGTFTSTPWSEIGDTIAVSDGGKGDPTYAGAPVLTGSIINGASRIPDGTDTDNTSDWVADDPSLAGIDGYGTVAAAGTVLATPGAANDGTSSGGSTGGDTGGSGSGGSDTSGSSGDTGGSGTGNDTTTPQDLTIQQINGTGYYSPYANSSVMTTGVVTAVDTNGSIGFWIQQSNPDKNTVGSSGIFIYAGKTATLPTVGETVSVTGTVTNYSGTSWSKSLTLPEINLVSYTDTGAAYVNTTPVVVGQGGLTVPAASYLGDLTQAINLNTSTASLSPDTNALDFYRNLIGQVITIHDAVAVGATVSNATWVVPDNGNGLLTPTGALQETADSVNTQRIELYYDSGVTPGSAISAEVGDKLGDVTGVLTYYNGVYELVPTTQVTVLHTDTPAPVTSLHKDDQNLLVSDYNIENFNALDPANADRLKQVAQIIVSNLDSPDVLALQEIQDDSGTTNDGTVSASQNLAAIVKAIADAGGPTYSWAQVDPTNNASGGVSGGNIRSVFLYNPERVSLAAPVTTIGDEELASGTFKNTRLPLVGTFEFNGQSVTLVNVHLSSQAGSSELYGSTQPPVNHGGTTGTVNNRIAQAQYITNYVNGLLTNDPTAKVGILGDFNDTEWSDAQQVYANAGLTDMSTTEDPSNRYTYIFEGNAESLDHTIGSADFASAGKFETIHVNTGSLTGESDHDPSVTLLAMTDYNATNGASLSDLALASGKTAAVHNGSTASNISVGNGSRLALYSGSTASNIALASGAKIDLPELAWSSSATTTLTDPSTLQITNGTSTYTIGLDGAYDADFFSLASDSSGGTMLLAEGTPCYCRGTLILTQRGEIPVETLQIGDLVQTSTNGLRPIRWIGRRSYSGTFANGNRDIMPVIFRRGSLGKDLPHQDLSVSPLHAMYLDGVLVPAVLLVNGSTILQAERMDEVAYFHIELEHHDIIIANGTQSETFVDDGSRGMFHNAGEYDVLYPDARPVAAFYCAPRVEEGAQLEAIRSRLNPARRKTTTFMPLEGYLDAATHSHVRGWARIPGSDRPVRLQIVDNGVVLGEALADHPRADLGSACGFHFDIPGGLSPLERHVLEVRRTDDHAALGHVPWMMDQAEEKPRQAIVTSISVVPMDGCVDSVTRNRITGWVCTPTRPDEAVTLQIVDNGVPLATVVANGRRPDVARTGRPMLCGFDVLLPGGLSPMTRHVLEIRRSSDGALLGEPQVLEPADSFDADMTRSIARAVAAAAEDQTGDQVLSFLLAQVEKLRQIRAEATSGTTQARVGTARRRRGMATPASAQRRRALVIDGQYPMAKRDAGSQAILSHMAALEALGYEVSFVAADQMDRVSALDTLPNVNVLGHPFFASVEDVLRRQANSFDVVYLHREDIATRYMALVRRNQRKARVLYSVADLHFLRLARQAAVQGRPELMAQANQMRIAEYRAALQADAVLTHSEAEADQLRRDLPQASVHVVPWAIPAQTGPSVDRSGVVFVGNYAHAPNADAARWLVEKIMPAVWTADPTIRCTLVGADMPESIQTLADDRIQVLGHVQDLGDVLATHRLSVAPLRFGAGIKGKVIESLASGLPCIMTPVAAEGLALTSKLQNLVQADAATLAGQIVALHNTADLSGLIEAGQAYASMSFSADTVTTALGQILTDGQAMKTAV